MSATEKALAATEVEVVAKPTRRRFAVDYKRKILREADACKTPGAVGTVMRRAGLYSSRLTTWRAARDRGELAGAPKKRGPIPQGPARGIRRSPNWSAKQRGGASGQSGLRPWSRCKKNSRCCWGRRSKPSTPNGDSDGARAATRHCTHVCRVGRSPGDLLPPTPATLRPAPATSLPASPHR